MPRLRVVTDVIDHDPQSGHLFLFFNKRRMMMKALAWEASGYWVISKRLNGGRFQVFDRAGERSARFELSSSELALLLFSRECVGIEVAVDMKGTRVTDAMNKFIKRVGSKPRALTLDNGTEFRSHRFDEWVYQRKVQLDFISPGKPVESAFIDSFNGSLRGECLNANWFTDIEDARQVIEAWRIDYNEVRPHSSLGQLPPAAYRPPEEAGRRL